MNEHLMNRDEKGNQLHLRWWAMATPLCEGISQEARALYIELSLMSKLLVCGG